jgi:hypothetical protein
MSSVGLRIGALVALGAASAAFGLWVSGGDPTGEPAGGGAPAAARWQSAQQCRECHQDVFDEWSGSHHQISYLNPEVRALSDDFRNKECQACHLPRPVAVTGYGQRVLPRLTQPDEGVSCLTCHLGSSGEVLGRHSLPDAPCAPVASADLIGVELCASCHNQHQTTDQWRQSSFAQQQQDCNHCHMPPVTRAGAGAERAGRSHRYLGAHDVDTLRAAPEFTARLEGSEVVVTLTNKGAGHNFPTEERHRAVDVEVSFTGADGTASAWERLRRFRQPYRDEPGENTQLPAGATWSTRVPVPAGARGARVRLWYRLTPFVTDDDKRSTLLFERSVEVP